MQLQRKQQTCHLISGVDNDFEQLMSNIFGADFMEQFKLKRPAGYVDLMIAFESRKRSASPYKEMPLNVSLPFSFIDYYKKTKVCDCDCINSCVDFYNFWVRKTSVITVSILHRANSRGLFPFCAVNSLKATAPLYFMP